MYELLGFDPKTFTNDELYDKQLSLTTKRIQASRIGKFDAANQLQMMIQAIEFERRERMYQERIGAIVLSSSPVVLETEIDLRDPEPDTTASEVIGKKVQATQRPIRRMPRTAKPT